MVKAKSVGLVIVVALAAMGCGSGGGGTPQEKIPETTSEAKQSIVGTWANCVKDDYTQEYAYTEITFYSDKTGYYHNYLSKDIKCDTVDTFGSYAQGFRYDIVKKVDNAIFDINITEKDLHTDEVELFAVRVKFEEGKIRFADDENNSGSYVFTDDPGSLFAKVSGNLPATASEAKEKLIGTWSVCVLGVGYGNDYGSRKTDLTYEANGTLLIKSELYENDTCSGETQEASELSRTYEVGGKTKGADGALAFEYNVNLQEGTLYRMIRFGANGLYHARYREGRDGASADLRFDHFGGEFGAAPLPFRKIK